MLKIKRIKLSGFRGILSPQELKLFNDGSSPTSLVVYGLNSSGKSSFVDGLEWFLSEKSEIEWLLRENAGSNAYPHQEATDGESFVEIEFVNEKGQAGSLTKTFDHKRITIPKNSSPDGFVKIYKSFVIRPYLRYLEIIDFVFNRTGVEKYQKLANWMGFEKELSFQEKIALHIIPELKRHEKQLNENVQIRGYSLKMLTSLPSIEEKDVLSLCLQLLTPYKAYSFSSMDELNDNLSDIEGLKSTSSVAGKISNLSRCEVNIDAVVLNEDAPAQVAAVQKEIDDFTQKKELVEKIDYIALYQRATDILDKNNDSSVLCPVCGHSWAKDELISHIKQELTLLQEAKEAQEKVIDSIKNLRLLLKTEREGIKKLCDAYQELAGIIATIKSEKTSLYLKSLETIETSLDESGSIFVLDMSSVLEENILSNVKLERDEVKKAISNEKTKIQPSKEELKRNEDIEKVKKISDLWKEYNKAKEKVAFYQNEIGKFIAIASELSKKIQDNITQRFKEISSLIGKYFGILRSDKDIKDIEITLNQDKGKAAGRSAEIQLSYYNIAVKPAYKVLSESLLNSLGLAVYFACIKQFNTESKFVVLDDIMNSLDVGHRDTLLDLIEQELNDYQVILFTHDLHWFEKIQRRFPNWIHKKIKSWDYTTGPKIDSAKSTREDIQELLSDSTKAKDAGSKFGSYVEAILNELCEDLQAELRYRFSRNDPPTMEELFTALHKRLKDKLNKHSVVEKVKNAQKYEPILRNATTHPRQNYSSSVSPTEVQRAIEEWTKVEEEMFCKGCNRFVEYKRDRNQIECRCGQLKLEKVN